MSTVPNLGEESYPHAKWILYKVNDYFYLQVQVQKALFFYIMDEILIIGQHVVSLVSYSKSWNKLLANSKPLLIFPILWKIQNGKSEILAFSMSFFTQRFFLGEFRYKTIQTFDKCNTCIWDNNEKKIELIFLMRNIFSRIF